MARNSGGRLNKLLEFIGLVDEDDDQGDFGDEENARSGRTYNPPSRKSAPEARPVRSSQSGYDARERYTPTGRQEAQRSQPGRQDYDRRSAPPNYQARSADASSSYYKGAQRDYDRQPQRSEVTRLSSRSDYDRYASSSPRNGPDYERPARQEPRANAQYPLDYPAQPRAQQRNQPPRGNVVSMRPEGRQQTVIYYLRSLEECRDVINDLLDNKTVLLNLEDMDDRLVQRGIDTLSGAAFALNATFRQASGKTYLIAPTNVEVALTNDIDRRY